MLISQKEGIIPLNWRPISLLNTAIKLPPIQSQLPSLIHEDQTGYIKGRVIGQNIRLIADIIECKNAL